jgi:predicted deacylase
MHHELAVRTIVGDRDGPHVLITAGVHGDEFEPMAAVRQLIQELSPSQLRGRVTLIPCVNEPAFRRGERTAEDGLDLARTCPGRAAGSVTERIACLLSEQIRLADYYVDLHTGGTKLTVYPLTGYMLHPRAEILAVQRRMARAFGLPLVWGTDPNLNGRSLSVARDAGVPAIYAEYLGGAACDRRGVAALVRGCRNVLAELKLTDQPDPLPVEPLVVEDPRSNSGFMQINHPAPCEGFFEPARRLGQQVRQGDLLGTITDLLGQRREPVAAAQTGCLIVLHAFARVTPGECLGVILETDGVLVPYPLGEVRTADDIANSDV